MMVQRALAAMLLTLAAHSAWAAPAVEMTVPPECIGPTDPQLCARLASGVATQIEKFGLCVIVTNPREEDVFVPLRTAIELEDFVANVPSEGFAVTHCSRPK
jgi:hypothetical protein